MGGVIMNTKKLAVIFSILLVTYFILQFSITFFKHGHHVTYVVKDNKNPITIDEVYTRNFKNERDNYYLTFKTDEIEFDLQLFNDFNKRNYIVKDAKYYNGDKYKCIYPMARLDGFAKFSSIIRNKTG